MVQVQFMRCGAGPFARLAQLKAHRKNPKKCKVKHTFLYSML
jgi:hypothetical protein